MEELRESEGLSGADGRLNALGRQMGWEVDLQNRNRTCQGMNRGYYKLHADGKIPINRARLDRLK